MCGRSKIEGGNKETTSGVVYMCVAMGSKHCLQIIERGKDAHAEMKI